MTIPDSRLHEITDLFFNPPRVPTPPAETIEFIATEVPVEEESPAPVVGGLPPSVGTTGAFRFVQEDELALEDVPVEQTQQPEEAPVEVNVEETHAEADVNGHTVVEESVTVTATTEVQFSAPFLQSMLIQLIL